MVDALHHLVITISDLAKTEEFYTALLTPLGWSLRGRGPDFVEYVPPHDPHGCGFLLVFGLARDTPRPIANFNRNQIGLDHFAFQAASKEQLLAVVASAKVANIELEDGGITDDDFGGTAIFCSDPDGMKFEVHLHEIKP